MLNRRQAPGILAKASKSKPKVNRLYYIVDLARFEVGLYQSLDMLSNALQAGVWGVKLDMWYMGTHGKLRYGKSIVVNGRFLIGKTEHLYHRLLKGDKINLATMPATTPIQSPTTISLPTIIEQCSTPCNDK